MNNQVSDNKTFAQLRRNRYKYSTCAVVAVLIFLVLTEKKVAIETCKL
jgi:hypothetical protein